MNQNEQVPTYIRIKILYSSERGWAVGYDFNKIIFHDEI